MNLSKKLFFVLLLLSATAAAQVPQLERLHSTLVNIKDAEITAMPELGFSIRLPNDYKYNVSTAEKTALGTKRSMLGWRYTEVTYELTILDTPHKDLLTYDNYEEYYNELLVRTSVDGGKDARIIAANRGKTLGFNSFESVVRFSANRWKINRMIAVGTRLYTINVYLNTPEKSAHDLARATIDSFRTIGEPLKPDVLSDVPDNDIFASNEANFSIRLNRNKVLIDPENRADKMTFFSYYDELSFRLEAYELPPASRKLATDKILADFLNDLRYVLNFRGGMITDEKKTTLDGFPALALREMPSRSGGLNISRVIVVGRKLYYLCVAIDPKATGAMKYGETALDSFKILKRPGPIKLKRPATRKR